MEALEGLEASDAFAFAASRSPTQRGRSSMAGVNSRQSLTCRTASARSRGATATATASRGSSFLAFGVPTFASSAPSVSSAENSDARTAAHSSGISSTSAAPLPGASSSRHSVAAAASKSGGGSRSRSASTDSASCFPFSFESAADLAAATAAARRALTFAARSADARTAHASRNPSAGAASGTTPTRSKTLASFLPLFFCCLLLPSSSR